MRSCIWSLALTLGCSGQPLSATDSGADTGAVESDHIIDEPEPWQAPMESIPDASGLADFMFDLSQVHQVDITMTDEAYNSLASSPYTYVSADVSYHGTVVSNVGVRIKGRLGSLRSISQKPALKVNIDAFVDNQNLFGLEELNLNNMVQDSAQVHDFLAYALYNALGVAAPRVGYVWVTINGSDYGLYIHVESYTDPFLERNFDEPDGNLYDGDYYMPTWGSYTKLDFYEGHIPYFQLDEGEDVAGADLMGIVQAINESAGTSNFDERVGEVVNMDLFNRFWATEMWLGQYDGYNYNTNNYRVYFDPGDDGRAMLMPWDHDWSFYSGTPITSPAALLSNYCRVDESCYNQYIEMVSLVASTGEY